MRSSVFSDLLSAAATVAFTRPNPPVRTMGDLRDLPAVDDITAHMNRMRPAHDAFRCVASAPSSVATAAGGSASATAGTTSGA
jgi:hypothetical protein